MHGDPYKSRETRAVLDAIRRIVHMLRESSRRAERHVGLTGAQLFVLQTLAEAEPSSVNDLAARTHTHQSSVSTVVSRLVEGGYVRRTRAAVDRRRASLSLTPKGRAIVDRAPGAAQERLIDAIHALAPTRRRALAAALAALAAAAARPDRAPAMFFEERGHRRG